LGYFKNLKELSSFMKELAKNWWFIRWLFDFLKQIENHNYSPIPTQSFSSPFSAWSSLTWVVNWQLWRVHYKWKHFLGDKFYLQKLKPYLVILFGGSQIWYSGMYFKTNPYA
jgi:hypothetical protein